MKIHIIGCSGTGKTYLANALSKKHNISHYDLDDIYWDNTSSCYGVKRPVEERDSLLSDILSNDSWIIEGVYYSWCGEIFEKADVIYFLDTPKHVYKWRIIKRFIKRKLGLEKGDKESLKSVVNLLKWTDKFQKVNRKEIENILARYENKTVWVRSKKDIGGIIKR